MIINEIVNIYENILPKCAIMLSHNEAIEYFERLMMNGNIITMTHEGELIAFLEFWRLDYSQWGRVCANITLAHDEDLLSGPVCLITRMWITPDFRNGGAFLNMGREFLARNTDATHYVAIQAHKKHKPLQVYNREDILKHYRMES